VNDSFETAVYFSGTRVPFFKRHPLVRDMGFMGIGLLRAYSGARNWINLGEANKVPPGALDVVYSDVIRHK
jgi:hypothetical protein